MRTMTTYCEIGKHKWEREIKRGRKPKNCPEHAPVVAKSEKTSLDRMREGREKRSQRDREQKVQEIIANSADCRCAIRPEITDPELRELCSSSCTAPAFVCPTLDRVMRTVYTYD